MWYPVWGFLLFPSICDGGCEDMPAAASWDSWGLVLNWSNFRRLGRWTITKCVCTGGGLLMLISCGCVIVRHTRLVVVDCLESEHNNGLQKLVWQLISTSRWQVHSFAANIYSLLLVSVKLIALSLISSRLEWISAIWWLFERCLLYIVQQLSVTIILFIQLSSIYQSVCLSDVVCHL